jgi:hypothetical protein
MLIATTQQTWMTKGQRSAPKGLAGVGREDQNEWTGFRPEMSVVAHGSVAGGRQAHDCLRGLAVVSPGRVVSRFLPALSSFIASSSLSSYVLGLRSSRGAALLPIRRIRDTIAGSLTASLTRSLKGHGPTRDWVQAQGEGQCEDNRQPFDDTLLSGDTLLTGVKDAGLTGRKGTDALISVAGFLCSSGVAAPGWVWRSCQQRPVGAGEETRSLHASLEPGGESGLLYFWLLLRCLLRRVPMFDSTRGRALLGSVCPARCRAANLQGACPDNP